MLQSLPRDFTKALKRLTGATLNIIRNARSCSVPWPFFFASTRIAKTCACAHGDRVPWAPDVHHIGRASSQQRLLQGGGDSELLRAMQAHMPMHSEPTGSNHWRMSLQKSPGATQTFLKSLLTIISNNSIFGLCETAFWRVRDYGHHCTVVSVIRGPPRNR